MTEVDKTELMTALAEDASYLRPRLFAIYGVTREIEGLRPESPFLGWGMELVDGGAIFREDDDRCIHISDSAERLLIAFQTHGEAALRWLED
jgi:hypothetical protein